MIRAHILTFPLERRIITKTISRGLLVNVLRNRTLHSSEKVYCEVFFMHKEEQGVDIDLLQIARVIWSNARFILIAAVVFSLLGLLISAVFMTPIYESGAKMIVNTRKDENQSVTNDQLNSAKNLVETYAIIIRGREVLEKVIEELDLEEGYGQLHRRVSVKAVNNTQVMQITVQHEDPETAKAIAEQILVIAPDMIIKMVEAGSVKTVERAHVGNNPVEPNILKNTLLAAVIGFVLACGVVVVIFLLDTTYKSELDIQNDLGLPVLGVIPSIESCNRANGYGKPAEKARGRR